VIKIPLNPAKVNYYWNSTSTIFMFKKLDEIIVHITLYSLVNVNHH